MKLSYHELLLSTMHMVTCRPGDPSRITDETLQQALTVNENLHSLGFTLRPQDIGLLAASDSIEGFYKSVQQLVPEVKAAPMYPDFPSQVMKISEAQFRFHQMMHYFSTYGQELLTGLPVSRGWLPDVESTPKTERDERLLEDTVLELVEEEESYPLCVERILSRRERLTIPEKELVMQALPRVSEERLSGIRVLFKENIELLFPAVFENMAGKESVRILRHLCQHTGDVLNNAHVLLKKYRYHFRTSQKRTLVKLLESYPAADFQGNLILSNTRRERNLLILRHLDYSIYSRSAAHKKAVGDLRRGQLHSWEGKAKRMLTGHEEGALAFTANRPGVMLRMLHWILSLGYGEEEIGDHLCAHADKFSTQMLVKLLSNVRIETLETILKEKDAAIRNIENRYAALYRPYGSLSWQHADMVRRESDRNRWNREHLDRELRNRLYELTEEVISRKCRKEITVRLDALKEQVRLLIQEKEKRILALEESILKLEKRISFLERTIRAWENGPAGTYLRAQNAKHLVLKLQADRKRMKDTLNALQAEVDAACQGVFEENCWEDEKAQIRQKYDAILNSAEETSAALRETYACKKREEEIRHIESLARIEKEYEEKKAAAPDMVKQLEKKEAQEIAETAERYERRIRALDSIPARKRILERILLKHLKSVETPLRDSKVFLDPGVFDLAHSLMETTDKSQDGTYVRSGFAWKIPDQAERVRFFVYWNDGRRVDLDLHASAAISAKEKPEGLSWFHVGWNGNFRKCGIVHSGDITHSDAAEFIDVDLSEPVKYVTMNINLYSGYPAFRDIEECFTGLMAVKHCGQKVRLYDPANCFFTHRLNQDTRFLHYGYINVQKRYVRFVGKPYQGSFGAHMEQEAETSFYVQEYLDILFRAQGAVAVKDPSEADLVLTVGKSIDPGAISLIDHNFFLDAAAKK